RERVRPGCDAANDTARRRSAAGNDPLSGVLFAGNRRSAATTGQPGILSVPPPEAPTRRRDTLAPIPSPERNHPHRAPFGADDIAAHPRRNGRTPAAWMMPPGSQSCSWSGSLQPSATGSLLGSSEVIAAYVHDHSSRKHAPYCVFHAPGRAEGLQEDELFGHVKGAFTGAQDNRPGLLELANRGTLFVDEIADVGQTVQRSLMRPVEQGTAKRVG